MTREELLKSKVIKALAIAVSAKSTNGYEKMFLEQVAAEVSKYDVYSVNIAEAALFYVSRLEESPAIIVLKRDLTELLDTSHF